MTQLLQSSTDVELATPSQTISSAKTGLSEFELYLEELARRSLPRSVQTTTVAPEDELNLPEWAFANSTREYMEFGAIPALDTFSPPSRGLNPYSHRKRHDVTEGWASIWPFEDGKLFRIGLAVLGLNQGYSASARSVPPISKQTSGFTLAWEEDLAGFEDILVALGDSGLDGVVNRLSYLQRAVEDDPTEVRMELRSLRHLARFLIVEQDLPHPRIAVSPDGQMQVEWYTKDNGIVAMKFLLDGRIQFAGIAGRTGQGTKNDRVSGTLQKDDVMRALQPFTSMITSE